MKHPSIKIIGNVHSNVYFCRNAVLVRLVHGLNRLCWKRVSKDDYKLYFEGQPVIQARIPSCGTCSDHLWKGYGDKITSAECQNTRDRINGGFQSLEQSVRDFAPMIGLFADGDYVVADYDLHPCINGVHFWNGEYDGPDLLHEYYAFTGDMYDSPLCLFPTERADYLDWSRVTYYKNRLMEGGHYPRAIAYYLSGGIALLLDGHHKAAAAAWEGRLVRCIVIMHVNMTGISEWMSLNQNRTCAMQDGRQWPGTYAMSLNDRSGNVIGLVSTVTDQDLPIEESQPEGVNVGSGFAIESDTEWGSIPEELCQQIKNYQNFGLLSTGMMIPRDRIRQEFDKLIRHTDPEKNAIRLKYLSAYCRAFPDSKWITGNQREWLKEMERQF